MRTSTALAIILSASASLVAAQQKCDAQKYVPSPSPSLYYHAIQNKQKN